MTTNTIRVLILSNDPLSRAGLAALLEQVDGCEVVGREENPATLLADLDAIYRADSIV